MIAITANREGFEVSHVLDVHDKGIDDVDWITRFSDEGGTAIISGDNNILKNWPNLIAYKESGLIGFFPPPKFSGLTGYAKAALLIRWWPVIVEKIKLSSLGDTWRVPMYWTPNIRCTGRLILTVSNNWKIQDLGKTEKSFRLLADKFTKAARKLNVDDDEDCFTEIFRKFAQADIPAEGREKLKRSKIP